MPDIDRVFTLIDDVLASGGQHRDRLAESIGECVEATKRAYVDSELENDALVVKIDAAATLLERLASATNDAGVDVLKKEFHEAAIQAMACRRALLPLVPPGRPWVKLDPRETLFDDDDQYSFAVYDTLADGVAKLLHALTHPTQEPDEEAQDTTD